MGPARPALRSPSWSRRSANSRGDSSRSEGGSKRPATTSRLAPTAARWASSGPLSARMTRSGTFEPPVLERPTMASGEFSTLDMINRLDPRTPPLARFEPVRAALPRLVARPAQGEVVPRHRPGRRPEAGQAAIPGGPGTRRRARPDLSDHDQAGETRAVELNIGVRYGADRRVLHLRCHLADVTAKLRDESELRRRTQELTQANDELRRANRSSRN